jgi:hypothetical protein
MQNAKCKMTANKTAAAEDRRRRHRSSSRGAAEKCQQAETLFFSL